MSMHKYRSILASAVCLLTFAAVSPAFASNDAMLQLLKELRDNGTLSPEAYELIKNSAQADNEKTVAKIEEVKEETKAAAAAASGGASSWADRVKLSGDIRLRHQYEDNEEGGEIDSSGDRVRYRIRARAGIDAQVTDGITAGIGIASGSDDPRSTNQTFDDAFDSKGINLDYAYAQWAANNFSVVGGKFKRKNWLWLPTDMLWDGDINPEGISAHYEFANSFGTTYANAGYWLIDQATGRSDDPTLLYAQVGHKAKANGFFGNAAVTLYRFNDLDDIDLGFADRDCCNTVMGGAYENDYDSYSLAYEGGLESGLFGKRTSIFAEYIKSSDPDDEDKGYSVGFKFGDKKVKDFGHWQFKYVYVDLEGDAFPDFLPDSDRAGGRTGVQAHEFVFKYGLSKNVTLGLDYYDSELDSDFTPLSGDEEQKLLQTDLIFKFK